MRRGDRHPIASHGEILHEKLAPAEPAFALWDEPRALPEGAGAARRPAPAKQMEDTRRKQVSGPKPG